jgi:hypothetical protein
MRFHREIRTATAVECVFLNGFTQPAGEFRGAVIDVERLKKRNNIER